MNIPQVPPVPQAHISQFLSFSYSIYPFFLDISLGVQLDWLQVTTGKGVKSVASIGLNIAGQKFEAASSGNGPVDAAIRALKKVITKEMNLKEFTIQAIDKGSDDVGKVHMQVEYDGHVYYGFGADTDIVTASVEAYIDCINKFKIR